MRLPALVRERIVPGTRACFAFRFWTPPEEEKARGWQDPPSRVDDPFNLLIEEVLANLFAFAMCVDERIGSSQSRQKTRNDGKALQK
jgi:hypothetical protein